jgi:hypothetical protein
VAKIFVGRFDTTDVVGKPFISFGSGDESYALGRWPVLLAFALIIVYFVIIGQTGGTSFKGFSV